MIECKYDIRRVRELSFEELSRYLASVVLYPCYHISGHTMPRDTDIKSDADALASDILDELNNYRSLFVEEIKRALWDGAKGMFDNYYGLNIKTYICFLNRYLNSDRAMKIHKMVSNEAIKFGPKQIEGRKERTQEQIDEETRKYITNFVKRMNEGCTREELFSCYMDSDFAKAAKGLGTLHAPEAYVNEAQRLGMWTEAAMIQDFIRREL